MQEIVPVIHLSLCKRVRFFRSRGSLIRAIIFGRIDAGAGARVSCGNAKASPFTGHRRGEDRITGLHPGTDSIFQLNIRDAYIWRIGRLFRSWALPRLGNAMESLGAKINCARQEERTIGAGLAENRRQSQRFSSARNLRLAKRIDRDEHPTSLHTYSYVEEPLSVKSNKK